MHLTLLAAEREISKAQGKTLSDVAEAVALGSLMGGREEIQVSYFRSSSEGSQKVLKAKEALT